MALDALAIPFDITWRRLGFMADLITSLIPFGGGRL